MQFVFPDHWVLRFRWRVSLSSEIRAVLKGSRQRAPKVCATLLRFVMNQGDPTHGTL